LRPKSERIEAAQARMRKRLAPQPASIPSPYKSIEQDQHFTVAEVAAMWAVSVWTVRRLFSDVAGVLKIGCGRNRTYAIPARVLQDKHRELSV
jgi:hypothetical protein